MAKRIPTPFKYRGKWRASVTLPGGKRRALDFDKYEEAKAWIVQMLGEIAAASGHAPKLDGPTAATLADALTYYAEQWTVNKGGARAELNRINHYLQAAGQPNLRIKVDENGKKTLTVTASTPGPSAFEAYSAERRGLRGETYRTIGKLAARRCSAISPADIRELMSTMSREGLSDSTIQKEIALLRHVFNTAAKEWSWVGFKNPCTDLKLGKSESRFVVLPSAKVQALMQAAAGCDNPLVPAAIGLALDTAMRKGSLLSLDWARINLEHRTLQVGSKTGDVVLALSQTTLAILNNLPKSSEGRVLPMSDNALDMAWEGVREKAGLPTLQFRDLRHVAATRLAKNGMNAHQLQKVLGHKTITMAQVYVNMVQTDMIEVLDKVAPLDPVLVVEPLEAGVGAEIRRRRSDRITGAIRRKAQDRAKQDPLAGAADETGQRATTGPTGDVAPLAAEPSVVSMPSSEQDPQTQQTSLARAAEEARVAPEVEDEHPSETKEQVAESAQPWVSSHAQAGNGSTVLRVDFRARKVVNG